MCGFTGYFLKNKHEQNSETILKMLEIQRHRGPDDSGVLGINVKNNTLEELSVDKPNEFSNYPNLIFGFNRLSILDLSPAGHQPMINEKFKVALMMNGEIYNAFDYKPELIAKGYVFKGNSDTEVVLNLYLEYGLDGMLERINGMFALAIYDGRVGNLYLIRDRVGIKPLYVLQQENRIVFASEMKSFKALPNFNFELDDSKLSEFLIFRNTINNTLFKNIVNIIPGTYLTIKTSGDLCVTTYFDLRKMVDCSKPIGKEDLEAELRKSVKSQMISDVKLGCQLSGGVDSSLVTAFASEVLPKGSLETISIIVDNPGYSEKIYIDKVVRKLNLKSHQFELNVENYFKKIDEAIWHFEQPLNHPNSIGIKLLSENAKKHVTVLLSGEGADEAFAGYSRFLPQSYYTMVIQFLKKAIKNKSKFFEYFKLWRNTDSRYILQTAYGNLNNASLLYSRFSPKQAIDSRLNLWNSIYESDKRKKRIYELITYLPDLLMRQDKMSMAHSIENRVPFLDNNVLELALKIDDEKLVKKRNNRWEGKYLLKEICSNIFNEDFAFRDKMGFGIPLKSFFSSETFQKRWNEEILPNIKTRGVFNAEPLRIWMCNPSSMNVEQLEAVWLMVGFEIWAKQYID